MGLFVRAPERRVRVVVELRGGVIIIARLGREIITRRLRDTESRGDVAHGSGQGRGSCGSGRQRAAAWPARAPDIRRTWSGRKPAGMPKPERLGPWWLLALLPPSRALPHPPRPHPAQRHLHALRCGRHRPSPQGVRRIRRRPAAGACPRLHRLNARLEFCFRDVQTPAAGGSSGARRG